MRKVVIPRKGGYEQLLLEEAPDAAPGPGEIAVAVEAIGVNYADCCVRMGLYGSAEKYVGWPITPGFEVGGTVAALGEGVEGPAVGAPVLALTRFGGYASRVVVPAHQVFERPQGMDAAQGAAFPTVGLTAWYALCSLADVGEGDAMLVHSAAGGVGGALVQMGKIAGAQVVGVVGAEHKVQAVRDLGADVVIDKSAQALWKAAEHHAPGGYRAIFDANGIATFADSYAHIAPTGRLVIYGFHTMLPRTGGKPGLLSLAWNWWRTPRFDPFKMTEENRSVMAFNLSYLFERADMLEKGMAQLLQWYRDGQLRSPTITRFPLDRVADAHRALESAQTVGKLVLEP